MGVCAGGAIAASRYADTLLVRAITIVVLIAFIGGVGYKFAYDALKSAKQKSDPELRAEKARIKYAAELLSLFGTLGAVATIALYATTIDHTLAQVGKPAEVSAGVLKDLHSLAIALIVLAFAAAASGRKIALARYERLHP
ncbi:hypothetical protein D7S89_16730 [Trinickia fusca]|uniref:Uncharacterized protein n=1 Tax=Trinickia fusca TaxID=2419777 RepID=A0A494X8U1_9BURK|nr:hypothetical protein D7S89_16730 [Trinickia fusca]